MIYVCVVCMVSVKGNPLIKLTGARCQLWELMISPRVNIFKIRQCLLLVCPECNQLLSTMLEFRRTMHIGAKSLLFLYKNLRKNNQISPLEQEPELCQELPAVIGAQSDEWLPVANEEVVQSDTWTDEQKPEPCQELPAVIGAQSDEWLPMANEEVVLSDTWTDVKAPPVASKTKHVQLPPALPARIVNQGAVHVPEYNQDYAVLTPVNDDTNLQCKEDVVDSSQFSETSKIKELVENIQAEFSSVSDSSKVKKIKLNRQLFEAIRVTLKSPLTEEFDIKYEPESESESGCKTGHELAREWALELKRESALDSERKLELETEPKPECESERKLERESESKLARELAVESARELEPDSDSTLSCESDYEDPEHFPNIIFAKAFNGLAVEEPQMQETDLQGEKAVEHIHCHLVTNPPSEWPCTGEQCRLRTLDEEQAPRTPSDSPRDTPSVGFKAKDDVPGRPKCKLCERSFAKISMLWHHFERAHMNASLKCNVCRKEFRNEAELMFHKMKHQFKKTVEYQFEAPSRHACLECAVRCRGPQHLRAHLGTRTHAAKMQWRFQCDVCKRKCADKKRMAEHIQREHLAKELVKCSMCSASFRSARTLRRHVAKHMVESQTQKNKPTDTQTNGQARKRARDSQTKGHEKTESNILRNAEDAQTEMQTGQRKRPHHVSKTSTAGHGPPESATMTSPAPASSGLPRPSPGLMTKSTLTNTKRSRKTTNNEMYAYAGTRRNTHANANIKEQDHMATQTNGQTSKKGKVTHKRVNKDANRLTNELIDTYINGQDDIATQTNKPTRRITNRQAKTHTDTSINYQDDKEKQTDGQTRKKPRKPTNSSANTFTNKQVTHAYVNGRVNTHEETHSQARKNSKNIHADGRKTHTAMQENIPAAADTTHTHTNGGVRKRRKRAYVASKRARMPAKAAADRERTAVAKTSLYDMLSSFIL